MNVIQRNTGLAGAPAASIRQAQSTPECDSSRTLSISNDHAAWLHEFAERHGRPAAVLHIGNIGNNAYILSKALNAAGIESDVLSFDDYHVMACPEWEETDFADDLENYDYPAWERVDLRGFPRPSWFVQGRLETCLRYLIARHSGNVQLVDRYWETLTRQRTRDCAAMRREQRSWLSSVQRLFSRGCRFTQRRINRMKCFALQLLPWTRQRPTLAERYCDLIAKYQQSFPERNDLLTSQDFPIASETFDLWRKALARYDMIVGYSTAGIYPLVVDRPYFAFEHGTIRSIPFETTARGRLCALTYRLAQHAFITNADNHIAVQRLGLTKYGFLPHPLNEQEVDEETATALRVELRKRLNADFIVLHPARQHWSWDRHPNWEKGNDLFIEGFARFVREGSPRAGAVFVNWGKTVDASRALLANRGVADRVLWIEPQSNPRLLTYIKATDALADQFFLGSFGGIMPKALRLGRACLIHLDEERHRWCFPEMPPVINVGTPEEILVALTRLYRDRGFARSFEIDGPRWYETYHKLSLVTNRFVDEMRKVVAL
jgi:hypothetical protein